MACSENEPVGQLSTDICSEIDLEDAQYEQLESVFLATGKGRRPNLPTFELTTKLLMQMLRLRDVGGKSFDETANFLHKKLFPDVPFSKLRYLLVANSARAKENQAVPRPADIPGSSSEGDKTTLSQPLEIEKLGGFLTGLRRQDIFSSPSIEPVISHRPSSYGLLKDLLSLKKQEGKTYKDLCQWWQHLTGNTVTESRMKNATAKFQKKNTKLQPSSHREKGREIYNQFLSSSPFEVPSTSSTSSSSTSTNSQAGQSSAMDYHLISVCSPVDKKRKLTEDASDNISMMPTTPMTRGGLSRHFLSIPRSDNVFQTEDWRSGDSALFLPLQEDLMVNVRKVEQVSCTEGQYFVADHSEKYSRSLSGKVIHLWRYDKGEKKLYVSRSFLFTALQEYLTVQQYLQGI